MGFTKKSAEQFFSRLKQTGLKRVVDTRLNNVSQLAGFTKKDDLRFFLKTVLDIDYVHAPMLAPNKDILDEYKKNGGDWSAYERKFLELMGSRHIESNIDRNLLDGACLLCSEPTPHHCHRRLVAEYLKEKWGDVEIKHL
ncbi:DUF488 domain-containing protein [uncultured Aquimonas sp.]|uniref:DUF488 domain-containing protein n=1 Tax=uncultured Aquimonas sp. TaxID=385483 RepID=UPI002628879C|nr:DUF488 domain-containing protein [uncultured Aquimonas sp.]